MTIKSYRRIFLRMFALLLGALALAPAQAQDILIGQVGSQTSVVTSANSKGMFLGMQSYFDSINAQGGVGGRHIKVINKDDGLNPAKMIELTKEFAADKDVLALGCYLNTGGLTALSKQDVLGQLGIGLVAPLAGDKSIVGAANFFPFRSGYPDEVAALIKEAADTQKKKLVIVYWNVTFGPSMMQLAQEQAKKLNVNVAATIKVDAAATDKFDAVMKETVAAVVKEAPDAVLMLMSSKYVNEFVKQVKESPAGNAQIYGMSVTVVADIVKAAGAKNARGVVLAQAVPYPFSATLPAVNEYQKLMKQYAPNEPLSFSSLEGFTAAKIITEALRRASPKPTRDKVLKALNELGEYNLGGIYVNYSPKARQGWGGVDLTIIGENGKLLR